MDKIVLDLYTDYLISSFGQITATGLSDLLGADLSHDRISRFLKAGDFSSVDRWKCVKPLVRQLQAEDGVLIIDDSVEAKPYTDESELICRQWDHTISRSVKGINLVTCLYHVNYISLPVAFELVKKPDLVPDKKTGRLVRKAQTTKNELYRQMLQTSVSNGLLFRYVLNDSRFASAENMVFVKETLKKEFVMPLKANRNVSRKAPNQSNREFVTVSTLSLEEHTPLTAWLEDVDFPLLLLKQVFKNEDGSEGILYLVTGDTALTSEQIIALYQNRWKVEEYHKSIKSNLGYAKSPTKTVRTQGNHVFACLLAFVKLERLRMHTHLNHFVMKAKLYQAALATTFRELQTLKANCSLA